MRKVIIKLLTKLIEIRTRWRGNFWHFRKAVRKAEKLAAGKNGIKGRRTYVYFLAGRYRTFNRKDIQRLKNAGVFNRNINVSALSGIQLYDTMTKTNSHPQFKNAKL